MLVKIVDQITDEQLIESAWQLYEEAFGELNASRCNAISCIASSSTRSWPILACRSTSALDDDGTLCGMSTYTNDLKAVPLIAPEYFEHHWPGLLQGQQDLVHRFPRGPPGRAGPTRCSRTSPSRCTWSRPARTAWSASTSATTTTTSGTCPGSSGSWCDGSAGRVWSASTSSRIWLYRFRTAA